MIRFLFLKYQHNLSNFRSNGRQRISLPQHKQLLLKPHQRHQQQPQLQQRLTKLGLSRWLLLLLLSLQRSPSLSVTSSCGLFCWLSISRLEVIFFPLLNDSILMPVSVYSCVAGFWNFFFFNSSFYYYC